MQFWDTALSGKTTADWTVAITAGKDAEGRLYILNVWRARIPEMLDPAIDDEKGLAAHIAAHIMHTRPAVVGIEENTFQSPTGKSLVGRVARLLVKHNCSTTVTGVKVAADKVLRAQNPANVAERGDMFVNRRALWWPDFLKEVMGFPNAAHDDQVDALAGVTQLATGGITTGQMDKHGYGLKGQEDAPAANGWNPFVALERQYAVKEQERIQRVVERTRRHQSVHEPHQPIPA